MHGETKHFAQRTGLEEKGALKKTSSLICTRVKIF